MDNMVINGVKGPEFVAALERGDEEVVRRGAGLEIPGEAGEIFRSSPAVSARIRLMAEYGYELEEPSETVYFTPFQSAYRLVEGTGEFPEEEFLLNWECEELGAPRVDGRTDRELFLDAGWVIWPAEGRDPEQLQHRLVRR